MHSCVVFYAAPNGGLTGFHAEVGIVSPNKTRFLVDAKYECAGSVEGGLDNFSRATNTIFAEMRSGMISCVRNEMHFANAASKCRGSAQS